MRKTIGITVSIAVLAITACSTPLAIRRNGSIDASDIPAGIRLVIDNREAIDVQVFVLREGARVPLGTVAGLESRVFTIPSSLATTSIILVATARAGVLAMQSPAVTALPGQEVSWRVERASFGKAIMAR